ncbi:helix-turn-helix transcriptional regulator [Methylobacterium mesophilicum]|uniref:helix-turn-helix domain-containing protein n=1 Tax=Methylobacterium mesophilicum TaxID=39956 RepID=UPI002F305935
MDEDPGKAIRSAREARGWSQEVLAERVGTTQSTIDRIENGLTRRSRVLPDVLSILNLAVPGLPFSLNTNSDQGKFQRVSVLLPPELVERIQLYRADAGISSEDEAIRRLLDDALKYRDNYITITDRLIEKVRSLKSIREAAGYVLSNHPLVRSMDFSDAGMVFCLNDGTRIEVRLPGIAAIFDENGQPVIFHADNELGWLDPRNMWRFPEEGSDTPAN